jgi:hypothetical protein
MAGAPRVRVRGGRAVAGKTSSGATGKGATRSLPAALVLPELLGVGEGKEGVGRRRVAAPPSLSPPPTSPSLQVCACPPVHVCVCVVCRVSCCRACPSPCLITLRCRCHITSLVGQEWCPCHELTHHTKNPHALRKLKHVFALSPLSLSCPSHLGGCAGRVGCGQLAYSLVLAAFGPRDRIGRMTSGGGKGRGRGEVRRASCPARPRIKRMSRPLTSLSHPPTHLQTPDDFGSAIKMFDPSTPEKSQKGMVAQPRRQTKRGQGELLPHTRLSSRVFFCRPSHGGRLFHSV